MKAFQRAKEPVKGKAIHPSVRWVWRQMNAQRASQQDIALRSGVSSSAMRKWRDGINAPKLADIEAVINALGGKLVIRMNEDDN